MDYIKIFPDWIKNKNNKKGNDFFQNTAATTWKSNVIKKDPEIIPKIWIFYR